MESTQLPSNSFNALSLIGELCLMKWKKEKKDLSFFIGFINTILFKKVMGGTTARATSPRKETSEAKLLFLYSFNNSLSFN